MPNQQLAPETVYELLADAALVGFPTVRLYGGEPLLHPQLPLLRLITIGYYGYSESYDLYVSRKGSFSRLECSIAAVRDRYGLDIDLRINFLLTRQTRSTELLRQAWNFARRYRLFFQVDLVHYSLPYFSEGPNRELQFVPSDGERLLQVMQQLLEIKAEAPDLFPESAASIRSIPDWALKGPAMEVPCDAYKMLWVGADGSVRLCYAAFPLGNIHQARLKDLFAAPEHRLACGQAFRLECPRCHCERSSRIDSHVTSRLRYGGLVGSDPPSAPVSAHPPGMLPILP